MKIPDSPLVVICYAINQHCIKEHFLRFLWPLFVWSVEISLAVSLIVSLTVSLCVCGTGVDTWWHCRDVLATRLGTVSSPSRQMARLVSQHQGEGYVKVRLAALHLWYNHQLSRHHFTTTRNYSSDATPSSTQNDYWNSRKYLKNVDSASLKFQLFAHSSSEMTRFDALSLVLGLHGIHSVFHTQRSQNRFFAIQDGGSKWPPNCKY